MKRKLGKIITIVAAISPLVLSSYTVLADTGTSTPVSENVSVDSNSSTDSPISALSVQENKPISLKSLLDASDLSAVQKQNIAEAVLADAKYRIATDMYRSRYYTSSETFSKAQTKKMAAAGKSINAFIGLIKAKPLKLAGYVIYSSYYSHFITAAKHGWGIKITARIDSYKQTTASYTYSFSYIK